MASPRLDPLRVAAEFATILGLTVMAYLTVLPFLWMLSEMAAR